MTRARGFKRAVHPAFDLARVIDEYLIFRQVLLEVFNAVQIFIRASVVEFSRTLGTMHENDVVQLREAQADLARKLNQSEQRFQLLVEGVAGYAIFTLDVDGIVTSWNLGAQRMKGYTSAEIVGRHFGALYPKDGNLCDEPNSHLRVAAEEVRAVVEAHSGLVKVESYPKSGTTFTINLPVDARPPEHLATP